MPSNQIPVYPILERPLNNQMFRLRSFSNNDLPSDFINPGLFAEGLNQDALPSFIFQNSYLQNIIQQALPNKNYDLDLENDAITWDDIAAYLETSNTENKPEEERTVYGAGVFTISGALSVGTNSAPSLIATTNLSIVEIYGYIRTAPTGADINIDINVNGVSILSGVLLVISAGNNTGSRTPQHAPSFQVIATLSKDDRLDIDIDQIGSSVAGSDLSVFVRVIQVL